MRIYNCHFNRFRSLHDTRAGRLPARVVFHGENNTGKSNILAGLQAVFQAKQLVEEDPTATGASIVTPTPFYYGLIPNFMENFEWNHEPTFEFELTLGAEPAELGPLSERVPLAKGGHENKLNLNGYFEAKGSDGDMVLVLAAVNGTPVYERDNSGLVSFLRKSTDIPIEDRQNVVESFLSGLTGLVVIVGSDRFLTIESIEGSSELGPLSFKRWLHALSLSRQHYDTYRKITRAFSEEPFNFGDVSFASDGGNIEIMVQNSTGLRLPIGRLGTGVQQVLVLLAQIIQSNASIIGIEEPELNLSFRNQDIVLNKIAALIDDATSPLGQLMLTSHSDHVGSRSDFKQYRVVMDNGQTSIRTFTRQDRGEMFPRSRRFKRPPF